jgi:molybdopterin-guanine dinucleotide biosynthesis protein MobB
MKLLKKIEILNIPLIGFVGFSGSGKSTLIKRLVASLSAKGWRVGYLKHDGHKFSVDKPGKDSFIVREAGANPVLINSADSFALMGESESFSLVEEFRHCHFVIIEGYKESNIPKFVVAKDSQIPVLDRSTVVAGVGRSADSCSALGERFAPAPLFLADDLGGVEQQLLKNISLQSPPTLPVIMIGGQSSRMGSPKELVAVEGEQLLARTIRVVKEALGEQQQIVISLRQDQMVGERERIINQLEVTPCFDRILNAGPMGGVASVLMEHRGVMPLVLPSDAPQLSSEFILTFSKLLDSYEFATAISDPIYAKNGEKAAINPLIAGYHPKILSPLMQLVGQGRFSLRRALETLPAKRIGRAELSSELINATRSFNTKDELDLLLGS